MNSLKQYNLSIWSGCTGSKWCVEVPEKWDDIAKVNTMKPDFCLLRIRNNLDGYKFWEKSNKNSCLFCFVSSYAPSLQNSEAPQKPVADSLASLCFQSNAFQTCVLKNHIPYFTLYLLTSMQELIWGIAKSEVCRKLLFLHVCVIC